MTIMMKRLAAFLGAALLAAASSGALAQSSPNFSYGQVPTAKQWNDAFSSKQDRLTFAPLNPAGGTMQGKLQAAPSTVNAAGLTLQPGTSPSVPVNGDIWTTSVGLFSRVGGRTLALPGLDQSTGALLVPNGPTLGTYQNGQYTSQPYAMQIGAGGVTGPISAASVLLPNAGNTPRTLQDKLADYAVSVLDFATSAAPGATPAGLRSCAVDATAAFQAAADKIVSLGGGKVLIPRGFYCIGSAGSVIVRGPMHWEGEGRGVNSGTNYTGGTLVRTANVTGDVFSVQSRGAVKFNGFAIDGFGTPSGKTAGAGISLNGDTTNPNNMGSEITGMYFGGALYDAIRVYGAYNWSITNNVIIDYAHDALSLTCESGPNPDGSTGQSHIVSNVLQALNTAYTARASLLYQCGGDVEVAANKLIGGQFGLYLLLQRGPTGTITLAANSFEQAYINNIRVEKSGAAAANANFGNLTISGNQFSVIEDGSGNYNTKFQGSIALVASSSAWLSNVSVVGNVFNMGTTAPYPLISVQTGRGVVVANNTMTNLGNANTYGFATGAQASKVLISDNEMHDMPGGLYNGVTSVAVVKDTVNKPATSSLGSFGDGSCIYVSDGTTGSTFNAAVAGGGTGAFAGRLNGAWVNHC